MGSGGSTHYDVLNVSPASDAVVIRAAYKALMRKYHPDVFGGDAAEAHRMSKAINAAFAVLGEPAARARYDAEIRAAGAWEHRPADVPSAGHRLPPQPIRRRRRDRIDMSVVHKIVAAIVLIVSATALDRGARYMWSRLSAPPQASATARDRASSIEPAAGQAANH